LNRLHSGVMGLLAGAIRARPGLRRGVRQFHSRSTIAIRKFLGDPAAYNRPTTALSSILQIPRHFSVIARSSSNRDAANAPSAHRTNKVETEAYSDKGLFGLRGLHTAEDFPRLAHRCIARCDGIREDLQGRLAAQRVGSGSGERSAPSVAYTQHTLVLLDAISNEVCRVIDAAELVRNVHAQPAFRRAAETAFSLLSEYITVLNADVTLYNCVCAIMDGPSNASTSNNIFAKLTEEQQLVAVDLRREFEADGIHFGLLAAAGGPQAKKHEETSRRLAKLQQDVTATETSFMQTAASGDNALFLIGPFGHSAPPVTTPGSGGGGAAAARAAAGREAAEMRSFGLQVRHWLTHFVPQEKLQALKQSHGYTSRAGDGDKVGLGAKLGGLLGGSGSGNESHADADSFPDTDGEYAVCTSKKHISRSLLVSLHPSEVRAQVWAGSVGEPAANRAGLGALIRSRQALAAELGYPSYAEKVLSNSVAGNESEVWDFLVGAAHTLRPHAEQELEQLKVLAAGSGGRVGEIIQPWDISYWSGIQRSRASEGGASADRISEYFPLSAAVDALADLTHSLFGLSLRREPMAPGEVWLSPSSPESASQGAFKLVLEGAEGVRRGTIYMDLHQRTDKFTGAAHFTVQCGCAHSEESTQSPQLPVVALVFNFPASGSQTPLLTLGDLTTFFHEFGHALHSVLSQTTYQHLSGTRGPLDFVEVPSHLFEAFTTDIRCLQRWARHHVTGKAPPAGMLEEALAARRSFEALEASSQVLYSLVDQHIFGTRMGPVAGMSNEHAYAQAVRAALELQTEHTALSAAPMLNSNSIGQTYPYVRRMAADLGVPGEKWHPAVYLPSHSHFVTYGGGYYAYLYAKMCAAQIWTSHFSEDPLSRASGERLWRNMLGYGVSRPPKLILKDMLGGALDPKHYYRAIGAAEH